MRAPHHIVLVGPMGVGKTTIGLRLAAELGRPFVDSDAIIEATGADAATLARTEGVPALHRREAEVVLDALTAPEPTVVAAASSVVDDAAVRAALADHDVVWLRGSPEVLAAREAEAEAAGDHHRRVLGRDPVAAIAAVDRARAAHNRAVADVAVTVDGLTVDEVYGAVLNGVAGIGGFGGIGSRDRG
jgi:shikimate kinase